MKILKKVLVIYSIIYMLVFLLVDQSMTEYSLIFTISMIPFLALWIYLAHEYIKIKSWREKESKTVWLVGLLRYIFAFLTFLVLQLNLILYNTVLQNRQLTRILQNIELVMLIFALVCVAIYMGAKRSWEK